MMITNVKSDNIFNFISMREASKFFSECYKQNLDISGTKSS